ncbi:MAG: hypothetical protein R3D56_14290 [Paracoccaceae bacterium]
MSTVYERHFAEAWSALNAYLDEQEKEIRGRHSKDGKIGRDEKSELLSVFCLALGISPRMLKSWREDNEFVEKSLEDRNARRQETIEKIVRLYWRANRITNDDWQLADSISKKLQQDGGDFHGLRHFAGKYTLYRKGQDTREEDGDVVDFINGTLTISNDGGQSPYMHRHKSVQDGINHEHSGPIYDVNNSLYFVGIGRNNHESYFRGMIVRKVREPRAEAMFGVLLSELSDGNYTPFGALIALVHEEVDKRLSKKDRIKLLQLLAPPRSSSGVIHGRGRLILTEE